MRVREGGKQEEKLVSKCVLTLTVPRNSMSLAIGFTVWRAFAPIVLLGVGTWIDGLGYINFGRSNMICPIWPLKQQGRICHKFWCSL